MMQADALVVREKLQPVLAADEIDGYSAVRKIGQGLLFVVVALVNVMFPKVARSFHRSEKTEAFKLTVWLTASIAVAGALVATFWPELPLLVSPRRLMESKGLVAWYCWALVPLALSNVLVWNLLARERFRFVWFLVALAAAYWIALRIYSDRLMSTIGVVLAFNVSLLLLSGVFVWLDWQRRRVT
jgi:O-antigen/teichoic acid export membrane protein